MVYVSIVIVNYNGLRHIAGLLKSLQNQTFRDFEIILIDNASVDGSLQLVKEYKNILPIKIVENKKNVGFCIATNQAIYLSKGKWVVLLNNDTLVDERWLEELIKRANSGDMPAAVVSRIVDENSGSSSYGSYYDIFGATLARSNLVSEDFFYGCGASLMVDSATLRRIGGLDTSLFMYQDDPDLCWRIRLLGHKIVCADRSICYHLHPSKDVIETNLMMPVWKFLFAHPRNRIRVIIKNYSYMTLLKRLSLVIALIQMRALLLVVRNRNPQYQKAMVEGLLWNLYNLNRTLKARYSIQRLRKVSDKDVDGFLVDHSIELQNLKLALFRQLDE